MSREGRERGEVVQVKQESKHIFYICIKLCVRVNIGYRNVTGPGIELSIELSIVKALARFYHTYTP